jgi:hypothetical protein
MGIGIITGALFVFELFFLLLLIMIGAGAGAAPPPPFNNPNNPRQP